MPEEYLMVIQRAKNNLIDFEIATNPKYEPNWHHERIAQELEFIEKYADRDYKILLVFQPPRHGKSQQISIDFPAWYLGRNPDKEIITSSYSGDLAQDFGGKTREKINSNAYKLIFSELALKEDEKSRGHWRTKDGGSYISVGVGGALTGRGANCFPAGTLITTNKGKVPIEYCNNRTRVVSYNDDKNILEIRSIKATLKRIKKRFIGITTTKGRYIASTDDHRFFVVGKGYIKAKELKKGERFRVLSPYKKSNSYLHFLQKGLSERMGRVYQKSQTWAERFLLRKRLFGKTSLFQKQQNVSYLRKKSKKREYVLFESLYSFLQKIKRYLLLVLWKISKTSKPYYKILFNGVQEQFSFAGNVGTQSKLQARNGIREISTRISAKEISSQKRPKSEVSYLQYKQELNTSSSGYESAQQFGRKFSISMQKLSYNPPQIKEDTISSIAFFDEELDVYDIEVEKNHNFFANDILVHNCLFIDDPVKNREEAESQTYRDKIWDWFLSTAFTRLEPRGVCIIIMTRWHLDDLSGRILENEELNKICKVISFPAIAIKDGKNRKLGEPLWIKRFNLDALQSIKSAIGPYEWQALYQGSPILTENQEFNPQWYKKIKEEEVEKMNCRRVLTIDTAMSKQTYSDNTGFCDNRINKENFWHLKAWKKKIGPEELVEDLFALYEQNHYDVIGIEKTAYLEGLKPFLDAEQRKRARFLPIMELSHKQTAKEIRIRGLIPRYASGSVFHIENQCSVLEEEQMNFPFAITDDVLDATAYQLQVEEKDMAGITKIYKPHWISYNQR